MNISEFEENFVEACAPRKPIAVGVEGAITLSALSRSQLYEDMRSGLLLAYKNGRRTIIFIEDLERYLRALPRAKFKPLESGDEHAGNAKLQANAENRAEADPIRSDEVDADPKKANAP